MIFSFSGNMDFLTFVTFLLFLMPSLISSSQNILLTNRKIFLKDEAVSSYAVIFDAGSTGSRVHVYQFDQNLDLLHIGNELEFSDKVKPGLSAYADNPEQAAESLIPLLKEAESVVPEDLHPNTPVRLGATAGLRLLENGAAEKILQAVSDMFTNRSSLNLEPDAVAVIDGVHEGSYLWVTTNYLLGKLGKRFSETVGVIDLGGGSVQMAYAVSKKTANNAPQVPEGEEPYIKNLVLKGKEYNLYVHSYLGYGKEASRAKILKITDGSANPCILTGFDGTYTYTGVEYKAFAPTSGPNLNNCRKIVLEALNVNESCPHSHCTFGGVWNGGRGSGQKNLFVATCFYYLATDVGIADLSKPNSEVRPVDFITAAKKACGIKFDDVKSTYPTMLPEDLPYVCMDLIYQYTLLVDGFGLDPLQVITVVNEIEYQDSLVEAAWPLGSAIEVISSLPKFERLMYFV